MSERSTTATRLELKSNLGTIFLPGRHIDNLTCHKVWFNSGKEDLENGCLSYPRYG